MKEPASLQFQPTQHFHLNGAQADMTVLGCLTLKTAP